MKGLIISIIVLLLICGGFWHFDPSGFYDWVGQEAIAIPISIGLVTLLNKIL